MAELITNPLTVAALTDPKPIYSTEREGSTIRPVTPEGDAYFGLEAGTNGTAAECRRALVQRPGERWVRFDGRPATGLRLAPPSRVVEGVSPWSGSL